MNVTTETDNLELLRDVRPLIEAAEAHNGHFNWSYSKHERYINQDIRHCEELLAHLQTINNRLNLPFAIGSGSSHIWVSVYGACRVAFARNFSSGQIEVQRGGPVCGIEDRILLITDND